jgi:hypothetical protein
MSSGPQMSALTRVGFIVPAVEGEGDLLVDCVCNLLTELSLLAHLSGLIIVCWQSADGVAPVLPDDPRIRLLTLDRIGASAARNRGLDAALGLVDAVMFTDVSVRPDAAFLAAAVAALRDAPMVSAPVCFANEPVTGGSDQLHPVRAGFVVFRGFIWSSLFRADALTGLRFDETIGPGTTSAHQSGEDARLLHRIVTRLGLTRIPYLPGRPVRRLPRPDLAAKEWRYALGQGYLVGQYLRYPTSDDRPYFLFRAVLFLGRSVLLLLRGRDGRALGRRRIGAFLSGLGGRDSTAPVLRPGPVGGGR